MNNNKLNSQPFKLYRGIVVDNNDPDKYGRVRVKIFGLNEHEANDNLPWAEVMQPCGLGLVSGVGLSAVLKQGTWVLVVFENNNPMKQIVIGVTTGINEVRTDGFADPDNVYPLPTTIGQSDFGQCNINEFSLENKGLTDSTMSSHGVLFNYQTTVSEDSYKDSWILRTEKGMMIEIDDSGPFIKITHPEGTYIVINEDGSIKVNAVESLTLNTKKDLVLNVLGDFKANIDGSVKWDIMKSFNMFCNDSYNWTVNQNVNWTIGSNFTASTGANTEWRVGSSYKISSSSVKFSTNGSYSVSSNTFGVNTSGGNINGVADVVTKGGVKLGSHIHRHGKPNTSPPIPS